MRKAQNPSANVEHPSILLSTIDIEKAHRDMKNNGVEVEYVMSMPYSKMFEFKDQDGNKYLLLEDK